MESVLVTELFKQAPTLGVLVFIIWIFLKHIKEYQSTIKDITDKCEICHRDAVKVVHENTLMMGETKECLKGVNYTLKRMNGHAKS